MSAPLSSSGGRPATGANDGMRGTQNAARAPAGRMRAGALIVASTGLACFLAYASGSLPVHPGPEPPRVAGTSPPNPDRPGGAGSSRAATEPGAERPGVVERGSRGRLEEALAFLAGDGAGLVARDLALLGVPDGAGFRRLGLASALLGALTVSGLVGIMLSLGITRVGAVASALAYAISYPALQSAAAIDPGMARAPMLVGFLCLLLAPTDRRLSRGLRVAAVGVWLLCALAEPAVLCVLPGMVVVLYLIESDRPTCRPLVTWAAVAGGLLFGVLLAVSGITTRAGIAADQVEPPGAFLAEIGALGLAFLAAGAIRLGGRTTRGELLFWVSGCSAVAWMLCAESVDTRGLKTVLILTVPLVGCGISAALRSRPGRRHAWAVGVLSFLLPASGLPGAVRDMGELREDRSRALATAYALATALPRNATVATAANVEEPIAAAWRFAGADAPRVVEAPLDVRRTLQLQAELPVIVAFEPTRLQLEILGFRLRALGFRRSGLPAMARLRRWEGCTAVRGRAWANVATIVESRYVGVGFGERPGAAVLALYVTADGGPLDIEPGVSERLQSRIEVETFDLRDPGDAGSLRRRLVLDGLAAWRLGGRGSVQRVRMSRASDGQPLAALQIGGGRPGYALARVVEAADDEPVFLCRASRRATMRRYGRRRGAGGPASSR